MKTGETVLRISSLHRLTRPNHFVFAVITGQKTQAGGGGFSGFQVTGDDRIEDKITPQNIPGASNETTQKNPWTKN